MIFYKARVAAVDKDYYGRIMFGYIIIGSYTQEPLYASVGKDSPLYDTAKKMEAGDFVYVNSENLNDVRKIELNCSLKRVYVDNCVDFFLKCSVLLKEYE